MVTFNVVFGTINSLLTSPTVVSLSDVVAFITGVSGVELFTVLSCIICVITVSVAAVACNSFDNVVFVTLLSGVE